MTKQYKQYSKKQFEFFMRQFLIPNKLGMLSDITNQYLKDGNISNEYIYTVTTKNKAVDILIFSSIDMRSDKTRVKDSDCVRLVLRWKTKYGYRYARIAKHLRIETLFNNVHKSIESVQKEVFNLQNKTFKNDLKSVCF